MPIQNIDNYLMANRSQEASILKSQTENKRPAEQHFLTGEVQHKAERNLTRTKETEKTDLFEKKFDAKEKGKNEYRYQTVKKEKKKKEKTPKEIPEPFGRTIDIKL